MKDYKFSDLDFTNKEDAYFVTIFRENQGTFTTEIFYSIRSVERFISSQDHEIREKFRITAIILGRQIRFGEDKQLLEEDRTPPKSRRR